MLPRLYYEIDKDMKVGIRKFCNGRDVSRCGAFRCGDVVEIEVSVSRALGMTTPVLRICRDGEVERDIPMSFGGSDNISDIYCYSLDTAELCGGEGCGLFYYEMVFVRGANTLYTDTYNNVDFTLSETRGGKFRLLIYEKDFKTPESFGKGVMYQIFPDRFYRGEGDEAESICIRDDAIFNEDWDHGIPQFASRPGEALENNMFFGGTLYGVAQKLPYLASLGVRNIYLCPIFEAYSNHRYDTGDYLKVDGMLGGDSALRELIEKARGVGISIILDGVFNHTGDDSIYFNKRGRYGAGGAYNDPQSPYVDWYRFKNYPDEYESWWGIEILPRLNHDNDACRSFFTGRDGVIQKYIKMGIGGWRLDVADELSDVFLDELRVAAKGASDGEAVIIGEVWENAAEKQSYGSRRRYFQGRQLDSVMNYPLRSAIIYFCLYGDEKLLYDTLVDIYSSYPREVSDRLMNIVGTHDTERILTVLGRDEGDEDRSMDELSVARLSKKQRERGIALLKIAAAIQYTVYGIPSLYYGDEIGLEGYRDPFCRMPFPWNEADRGYRAQICDYYRRLGELREHEDALDGGDFYVLEVDSGYISYVRQKGESRLIICANRGSRREIAIPRDSVYEDAVSGERYCDGAYIDGDSVKIFKEMKK